MPQVKGVKEFIKVAGSATKTGRYGGETLFFAISAFVNESIILNHQGRVTDRAGNSGI
jgi:hypothetical protein